MLRIRSASSPRLETPGFWKINRLIDSVADAVQGYFDGDVRSFSFPMVTPGTDFQEDVWSALLRIPYGETRSYAEIATEIGRPLCGLWVAPTGSTRWRSSCRVTGLWGPTVDSSATAAGFGERNACSNSSRRPLAE